MRWGEGAGVAYQQADPRPQGAEEAFGVAGFVFLLAAAAVGALAKGHRGLLEPSRQDLNAWQKPYAHEHAPTKDLHEAVQSLKPNILIGVSTVGGTFTEAVVKEMSKNNERPIIFALSKRDVSHRLVPGDWL